MKSILIIIAALVMTSCSNAQREEFRPEALTEEITALNGEIVPFQQVIDKHKGKPVLIEIWASWCGDCVKAMPKLKETQQLNPDVAYVFVSMDKTEDKWKAGIEKHQLRGDHYWAVEGMKGSFGKALDVDWIPRYIIIDPRGKVALYRAVETDFEKINQILKDL